jgi:hypothetical protein
MEEPQGFSKPQEVSGKDAPLSPLLYAIQASVLSLQLEFGQLQQNLSGLRIAKGVKDINHAQYADDTLLLGGASTAVAKKFKKELDVFTNISGSVINTAKSKIYGWNVNPREMHEISRILGIAGSTSWEDFNYLGVPITKAGSKSSNWNKIIEKIKNRIRSWGANWLNLAGKLVLIKAVLSSISIYQSALLLAPRTVIQKVEVMIRHFLWEGGKQTGRRLHLVKWGKLTKALSRRGSPNKGHADAKFGSWSQNSMEPHHRDSHWSKRALWKKYFRGPRKKCLSNPTRAGKGSPIFSLCQKALPAFLPHLTWIPGNGQSINIWEDSVLGGAAISTRLELRRLKDWMQNNNIHSLWDISTWQNDETKSWSRWEIASLPQELEEEWSSLKEALQGRTPLREKKKDKIGWGPNAGIYTSARGYRHLVPGLQAHQDSAVWKAIWAVKTLPKVDLFVWTVAKMEFSLEKIFGKKVGQGQQDALFAVRPRRQQFICC